MKPARNGKSWKAVTLLSTSSHPARGEIWKVNFDPTIGAEIKKVRPAIVISSDAVGSLPIKLVAPVTKWASTFVGKIWLVKISPDASNGLAEDSAVDTLQIRCVDVCRFIKKMGVISPILMEDIAAAVAIVVEYQ
jgi:mRNA interferase MazF